MNNLQRIRRKAGLTREELSRETGIKTRTIVAWERSEVELIHASFINVLRLASALKVDPMELIGGEYE